MSTADEIYSKVKKYLAANAIKVSFDESCDPVGETFRTFWSHPTIRSFTNLPPPNSDISKKGNDFSEKFRNEGNRLYKERKFSKALLAYNYAVISATHPEIRKSNSNKVNHEDSSHKSSSSSYECLAFAYSNRSAVLFEMRVYDHSKADIDRAIFFGYPKSKSLKLEERKGKCLLNLGQQKEAEKIFREILDAEKSDKETNSQSILSLEKLLQSCNVNSEKCIASQNAKENFKNIFYRGSEVPLFLNKKCSDQENLDYSFRSEAVNVQNSTIKGRHLVASRDIEPGEILIVEKAYCSILKLNKNLRLYCCVCMKRSPIVLSCPTCSLVVFCSEECRTNDKIHYIECSILPTLITLKVDEEVSLVFRSIICSLTMKNIIKDIKDILKYHQNDDGPKLNYEFDSKFQNLFLLEGNLHSRSVECLQETAIYAVLVVQMLKQITQFWNCEGESEIEDTQLLGGLVMRWILCFQCNIHCLKELLIDKKVNLISATANDIGYGVYCAFSLMNHSCVPNVLHSSWGDVKFLFSTATIHKGEEIVDSYGERYASHDLETRQKNLLETYHFKCNCKACIENWPHFNSLPPKFSLKCAVCHKPLQPKNLKCEQCDDVSNKTTQSSKKSKKKNKKGKSDSVEVCKYDVNDIQKQLKNAWSEYDSVYNELNIYKASFEGIKKVSKLLSLLERYTCLPHKPYLEAQEVLLRSFDMFGSHFFIEEK